MLNVTYAHLQEGRTVEQMGEIDLILSGAAPEEKQKVEARQNRAALDQWAGMGIKIGSSG